MTETILENGIPVEIGPDHPLAVAPTDDEIGFLVREQRDFRLTREIDPVVNNPLRWNDLTPAEQAEISQYRRDLLDLTKQTGFPHEVTWPVKPTTLPDMGF